MKLLTVGMAMAGLLCAAEQKLGKPLTQQTPTSITDIQQQPDRFDGKTVAVKGKVTDVCQMAGCWMALVEPATGKLLRVKVNDGEIVFPKDAVGRMALAEGTVQKLELTRAQAVARAKHHAEEQGRTFDESSVTGPQTVLQLRGTGAVLLD